MQYILKRKVTDLQIVGSLIMALSVVVTKISDLRSENTALNQVSVIAILVALAMSALSGQKRH